MIGVVSIVFAAATAAAPAVSPTDFVKAILDAHNRARAEVSVPPLVWSDKLAREAATWAAHLAERGRPQHSDRKDRGDEGENLWVSTAGSYTPSEMVQSWDDEEKDFRYGPFELAGNARGPQPVVGHYTQIVWRDTREVGCAVATTRTGWDILVCRYSPQGNLVDEKPY